MTSSFLLITLPILVALSLAILSQIFLNRYRKRLHAGLFLSVTFVAAAFSYFVGAWSGLLLSIQINRIFFDYRILTEALGPNGIFVWYGFGPGLTPQFLAYWQWTFWILFILLPTLVLVNFFRGLWQKT